MARSTFADEEAGFRRLLHEIQRYPILDRDREHELAMRWKEERDRGAADALVCSSLRYVVKHAQQYRGYGLRMSDLVEEGMVGLMEAVRRFEPERNLRFMTYANYWIRAYMLAFVLKQWSIVGMGTGPLASRLFFRLHRERTRLASELGNDDTQLEGALAATFGTSEERIRSMTGRMSGRDSSLDAPAFRDGEVSAIDLIADESDDIDARYAAAERDAQVRGRLEALWPQLDARERIIVEERLLPGEDGVTLAELGTRLGLSRERVRQLEERVKLKLRKALSAVAHQAA
jgi:RNA polymerase sigma-32 factor